MIEKKKIPDLTSNKIICCGCGVCSICCPVQAISMIADEEGFIYPQINIDTCIGCNFCIGVCSFKDAKMHLCISNNTN